MSRVIHFDIAADDAQRAVAFYKRAFGWRITKARGPLDYWLIDTGKADQNGIDGGIAPREADWQRITMLVETDDADQLSRKIKKAGGSILGPRKVVPGVGYLINCADTENNVFALLQPDETAGF